MGGRVYVRSDSAPERRRAAAGDVGALERERVA